MGLLHKIVRHTTLQNYIIHHEWASVTNHLKYYPKDAKQWIEMTFQNNGRQNTALPLHQAILNHAPVNVIKALIDAYPKALRKFDTHYHRLPLHYACLHVPYPEMIALLLSYHEGKHAVYEVDNFGRLPLHYAAFGQAHEYIFQLLLSANPTSAQQTDNYTWLPLHIAVRYRCSHGVIERLVRYYPEGLKFRTRTAKLLPSDLNQQFQLDLDLKTIELLNVSNVKSFLRRQSSLYVDCATPQFLQINAIPV